MKALLSFLAASVICITTASADWVIESKIESPQMNGAMTAKIKGDKMRVDIPNGPAGPMSSIVDTKTGDSIQVIHGQKMAMTMTGAAMKQMIDGARQKAGIKEGAGPELKATGQSEKIEGLDCDVYTWSNGATSAKLWVAKSHPQAAALKAWEKQLHSGFFGGMQGGPDTSKLAGPAIKTESTSQGVTVTSTITSVKEQAVDAKEFDVPAGYQSMAMPKLPAGN